MKPWNLGGVKQRDTEEKERENLILHLLELQVGASDGRRERGQNKWKKEGERL